jgi:AcrR family transcriptional regulator
VNMGLGATVKPVRPYRSAKRQEQARRTRRAVLAAAAEHFRASGYAGTTMATIAATAGVSVPTIELAFSTKAALLKEVIDVAIAGDDEPVPVLERPWANQIQETTTAEEFLAGVADVLVAAADRADALVLVAFEAARSDERLAPLAAQLKAQRMATAAWIVDRIAARSPLRTDHSEAVGTIWLLMDPVIFARLTTDLGWTAQHYGAWFIDSVLRLLTEP